MSKIKHKLRWTWDSYWLYIAKGETRCFSVIGITKWIAFICSATNFTLFSFMAIKSFFLSFACLFPWPWMFSIVASVTQCSFLRERCKRRGKDHSRKRVFVREIISLIRRTCSSRMEATSAFEEGKEKVRRRFWFSFLLFARSFHYLYQSENIFNSLFTKSIGKCRALRRFEFDFFFRGGTNGAWSQQVLFAERAKYLKLPWLWKCCFTLMRLLIATGSSTGQSN